MFYDKVKGVLVPIVRSGMGVQVWVFRCDIPGTAKEPIYIVFLSSAMSVVCR